jgi:hypothetical protein
VGQHMGVPDSHQLVLMQINKAAKSQSAGKQFKAWDTHMLCSPFPSMEATTVFVESAQSTII